MGTANTGWFDAGSSPTVQYYIALDCSRASSSSKTVTCSYSIKAKLQDSGSTLGKGYTITINFSGGGGSSSKDIKASTDSWSGQTERGPWTGSFTFESTGTSTTFTMSSTTNTSSSGKFSNKTLTCSYGAYSFAPGPPSNVTIPSSQHFNTAFKITWTKGTAGSGGLYGYDIQGRAYNGSEWSDWVTVIAPTKGDVAEYSMGAPRTLNYGGNTVAKYYGATKFQFRVRTSDGTSMTSSYVNSNQMSVTKNGIVRIKDKDGTAREIKAIKMKDTSGTERSIHNVRIKDKDGTARTIELYY